MKYLSFFMVLVLMCFLTLSATAGSDSTGEDNVDQTIAKTQSTEIINLKTDEVKAIIEKMGDKLTIVDVRSQYEYTSGHIEGALLIPLNELDNRMGELAKDDNILVVCWSGSRSTSGAKILRDAGYKHIYNFVGGMSSWDGPVRTGMPSAEKSDGEAKEAYDQGEDTDIEI